MHPVPNKYFGPQGVSVTLNLGAGPVSGYIVQQLGNRRFVISDGTNNVVSRLAFTVAEFTPLAPGYFTIPLLTPGSGSGASFAAAYGVDTAFVGTGGGGNGYAVNDTVTFPHGAVLTVNAVDSHGAVTTFSVQSSGTFTASALSSGATNVGAVSTSGAGTGATAALEFFVNNVYATGGSGYKVGTALLFGGLVVATGGSQPMITISQVDVNGAPVAFAWADHGHLITAPATSITTPVAVIEHVAKLDSTRLETVEGHLYRWSLTPDPAGITTGTLAAILS